jgi:arginine decarboxylase-like protein
LFPICPIHRLDEEPTRRGVLADITCDSDGKIDHFVDKRDEKKILELHEIKDDEPYYLGIFLVGAYQEVLGDLHNLFGDTHVVHVPSTRHASGERELCPNVSGRGFEDVAEGVHPLGPECPHPVARCLVGQLVVLHLHRGLGGAGLGTLVGDPD